MRWLILISLFAPTFLPPVSAETVQGGSLSKHGSASVSLGARRVQERSLTEARLQVLNMSCPLCAVTVRKALERVPGVARAEVDFKTKRAVVRYDPEKTDPKALIRAIEEAGYGARRE